MRLLHNISFHIDPLALFFLAVIVVVSIPALIYSYGYLQGGRYSRARLVAITAATALFILSMGIVVCASNLLLFLFAWEIMSLVSYFLVVFDHEHQQSIDAGLIYLVMTHVGTALLTVAILIIYHYAGSFEFAIVRGAIPAIPVVVKHLLFAFLLFGFGTKAGIVPLHIWLAYAHPQAPSHISSMMSGVMIKIAVYGFLRICLGMLGAESVWWGITLLMLACGTCFVGVMYALLERDIKKVLAYSSVENMGIILVGIGTGMVLTSARQYHLAVVAYAAGLFHLINHTVFKGLLFLGAGSVYKATGTREIEKLGGLIKRMPWTAAFFLAGALAISGMPPFNGFVSEWLIFQSLFGAAGALSGPYKILFVLMMVCLALTGGLAAACFTRVFGIGFLAMPRSQRSAQASEVALSMKLAMGILAAATLVMGFCAAPLWQALTRVSSTLLGDNVPLFTAQSMSVAGSVLRMPLIFGIFFALLGGVYTFVRLAAGPARVTKSPTWDCGYDGLSPRNEYTSTAFSKPFKIAFSFFFLPQRRVEKLRDSYYHVSKFTYEVRTVPIFKQYFYAPLLKGIFLVAQRVKMFQMGSVHWYLGYILFVFLGLVIVALMR